MMLFTWLALIGFDRFRLKTFERYEAGLLGTLFAILGVLAIGTLWMGLYPQPFTEVMHASVTDLLRHVAISKIQ